MPTELMPAVEEAALLAVAVETLSADDAFDFDLYLRPGRAERPVLYRQHHYPCSRADLDALRGRGIHTLYIQAGALPDYQAYLRSHVLSNGAAPSTARLCALKEVNRAVFLEAMQNSRVEQVVRSANQLGQDLADLVYSHDGVAQDLFAVLDHDYGTFTHVTNVCVYTLTLAKHLSIDSPAELAEIATGALLHDVGKRKVAPAILNKPTRLNDYEMRVVRRHPQTGFEELSDREDLSWAQLMMVFQHHERFDGLGYPSQMVGTEIHPWARMCSIADVFDALTGYRPYSRPSNPSDAAQYLRNQSGTAFDREMVECWNKSVKTVC